MRIPIILAGVFCATSALADEDLARQLDTIATAFNAGQLDSLGGPDTPAEIVDQIDGRWFTLANTVRNWTGESQADTERLTDTIERTCSDTWENLITHEATGPDSFRIRQESPEGEDHGTFELFPHESGGRLFTMDLDESYILAISGLADADADRQREVLDAMNAMISDGIAVWRPTPDLMVNTGPEGAEIWGRCPGQ
ncbi:MAG: hypothetical protein KIT02_03305 [Devosia sp.]|uniref:hypothetical protein n=1 Tax=Devosia sp. TaxID=1871048 RepID=UPI0024CA6302|nr:hypothetical protein [Devosia sp.]UYO00265.1 MAG: hypothetical protein KIT02_03305 [Devosia sp.]